MAPQQTQVRRTEAPSFSLVRKVKGKLTTLEAAAPASVTALGLEVLELLRAAPMGPKAEVPATSLAALRAPSQAAPTSHWRALRVAQEIDRLALGHLFAYYGHELALSSALEKRGPIPFVRQGRRLQRAYDQLAQHVREAEAHPHARGMKVRLCAQAIHDGQAARLSLFAAIDHERSFGAKLPLLGHVRRTSIVGPSGFVPVLDLVWQGDDLANLVSCVPPTYATRGSRYFALSSAGTFTDPARPENVDARGHRWSLGLLFLQAGWSRSKSSRITYAQDREPQPANVNVSAPAQPSEPLETFAEA